MHAHPCSGAICVIFSACTAVIDALIINQLINQAGYKELKNLQYIHCQSKYYLHCYRNDPKFSHN